MLDPGQHLYVKLLPLSLPWFYAWNSSGIQPRQGPYLTATRGLGTLGLSYDLLKQPKEDIGGVFCVQNVV